ncbi:LytTR family DNA-binding domain-containing protein [Rhabdobacter roseus]|uniref:DNA-binding LytR/AlgR family response regulator n=1 Tax=Rhabdobacter roseus TaxID=1655419 RepID=A0A840U1V5_9BACT|nr:LytTR family DNA-binding domain-containing protein [Rhabdobacter roseus]MBB5286348.1 DNA-binding LytR/AlgR family response regulator [Rhabdobacter roseus]
MSYTCLIVEDEPLARSLMEQYVQKVPDLRLVQACASPLVAIEVLRQTPVDMLFLDINMPEITGITLLKILQKKPLVVLTTAYSDYALEGYELDVADYLLKPITFERFLKAIEKVTQRLSSSRGPAPDKSTKPENGASAFIFVKDGTKLVKVRLSDIRYIEGLKDYVGIYTKEKKIVTLQTLKALETQLPEEQFIRIHNSYIVAFDAIDAIDKEKVQIGSIFLPISDTYRKSFKEFIDRHHLGSSY